MIRPFQGVNLQAIQEGKIRQLQEQRLQQAQDFEREKYGFEKSQIEKQQQAQQLLGQSFRDAVGPDGEIDRSKLMSSVMTHNPELWPSVSAEFDKIDQAKLNKQRTQAQIDNFNSEVAKRKSEVDAANDEVAARIGAIAKHLGDTPEAYQALRDAEVKSGRVSVDRMAPFDQAIAQDPSKVSDVTSALMEFGKKKQAGVEGKTREIRTVSAEGKPVIRIVSDEPGQEFPVSETATDKTPTVASLAWEASGHDPSKALDLVRKSRPAQSGAAGAVSLTPDAIEDAAASYRLLGTRGIPTRFTDTDKKIIMNKAAEQAKLLGDSPASIIQKQAGFQADKSALTRMRTMQAAAQGFEFKAVNQIDIIKNLSNKVPRTSFPVINSALQLGRTEITGDTNATQLANAIETFSTEYAKVINGGTGSSQAVTDSARNASRKLLSAAMSKGTMSDVLDLMRREMGLTNKGYETVVGDITQRMGGEPSTPTATATAGGAGVVRWGRDAKGNPIRIQ